MIFRRFVQRLKQHQWGAIATELAIVIIGVFIGMQVSNWNEEWLVESASLGGFAIAGASMPRRPAFDIPEQFNLVIPAKAGIQFFNPIRG